MTIHDACQKVGKTESTIRRWIKSGKLQATKVEGIWDISEASVNALSSGGQTEGAAEGMVEGIIAELRGQIAELQTENRYLREELRQKDQAVAVAQNAAQELIERLRTPWFKRWFRRQKALPQGEVVDMEADHESKG